MQLSTDGIILRSYKHEENRILTVLTREIGIITAFANYANRPRSPLAATTELLCYSDFRLFRSKKDFTVDSADSKRIFFGIRSQYEDFSLASYWSQLFAELSPQQEIATDYLNLLLGCLHFLEEQTRPPLQLKSIAELRLLTLAGYMPDLVACSLCNVYESETMYFSLDGQLLCHECYGKLPEQTWHPIAPGVLAAMRHIVYADSRKIYSFTLSPEGLVSLGRVCEAYLLHQLGKTLPTLEFYRSLTPPATAPTPTEPEHAPCAESTIDSPSET